MTPPSPLLTDLYELTMAAAYFESGITAPATFSLYTRQDPHRGFYVAAGIDRVLDFLESFAFTEAEILYLRQLHLFSDDFLNYLATLRFTGDVWAMPEGSPFFADEPVIEITAPIIQAQLLETYAINAIGLASMITTKAARCVHAANGKGLIDFALRRTQGVDAGLTVARCTYLAGFDATSNVLAGQLEAIPVSGTMAHSFVMAFDDEAEAFRAYAHLFPQQTVLLIDTYDTLRGAHLAVDIGKELQAKGAQLRGVRLDSGDVLALSRQVRRILDDGGLSDVKIFASGGFDEYAIAQVVAQKAPIDAFGVGTKVGVSADAPYLDMVFKLVQFDGRPVRKLSPGKITLAGEKQVFRRRSAETGQLLEDIIALRDESIPGTEPMLRCMMRAGSRLVPALFLTQLRDAFQAQLKALPEGVKRLEAPTPFPIHLSRRLQALQGEA